MLLIFSSSARRDGATALTMRRARQRGEHGDGEHGSVREVSRCPGRSAEVTGESRAVRGQLREGEEHGERRPRQRRRGEHGAVPGSVLLQRSTKFLQNAP